MRKFILILSILFTNVGLLGQKLALDSISGKYQALGVVTVDSLKKEFIFMKSKEWIALNYKGSKDVIKFEDGGLGKIIIVGGFPAKLLLHEGRIDHTLILEFKDNRFRYNYTDFSYYSEGGGKINFESALGFRGKIFAMTEEKMTSFIEGLRKYLLENSKVSGEW